MHSTRSASDKVYQLLAHGRWFSPNAPASSITKPGRHDIAEILLKVALSTNKSINQPIIVLLMLMLSFIFVVFLSGRESLECLHLF